MLVNGKFQTKQGRILDFEFKTEFIGRHGTSNTWSDNTYYILSDLSINGESIGNIAWIDDFKNMWKDAQIIEFNQVEFDDFIEKTTLELVDENLAGMSSYCEQFEEWCDDRGYTKELNFEQFKYYLEEYTTCYEDFTDAVQAWYELANGYHCLSQINMIYDSLLEYLDIDYNEWCEENIPVEIGVDSERLYPPEVNKR